MRMSKKLRLVSAKSVYMPIDVQSQFIAYAARFRIPLRLLLLLDHPLCLDHDGERGQQAKYQK